MKSLLEGFFIFPSKRKNKGDGDWGMRKKVKRNGKSRKRKVEKI